MGVVLEGAGRELHAFAPRRPAVRRLHTVGDVLVVVGLAAAGGHLLVWRAGMLPSIGWAGRALFALEALTVAWLVLTAMLFAGRTDRRRRAPNPDPTTTLDVLIPVAGEPLDMLAATIVTARAIQWPKTVTVCNDAWMAGKDNWREVEDLCRRLGVRCLTRHTGARGKGGNLNHALAHCRGDAVLTVDADHQVVPDLAHQMLGWLRDPDVAFVSTPQDFMGSRRDPLNPTEPIFYRAVQPARDRHGLAFSTGNCVVYRRRALEDIGGFSEWSVVEDLHTSIRLHDAGWKSVFHPVPVSMGIAPRTSAEYARQRLRWAIDSLRILRHDPPWRRRGLGLRAKLHYSHTLLSYLVAMVQVGFLLGPPAWILGRLSLLSDGDWRSQALHIGPWLAMMVLAFAWWAGPRGAFRTLRLGAAFLPTVFWAAAWKARAATNRGTVTAKTNLPRINRLVVAGLALPVALLASMVWGVFDPRPGGSDIAMGWAAGMVIVASGPLLIGRGRVWSALVRAVVVVSALSLAGGSVAAARLGWEPPGDLYRSFRDPAANTAVLLTNELGDTYVAGPAIPADELPERPPAAEQEEAVAAPVVPARLSLAPADGIYVGFTSDALPYDLDDVDRWADDVAEPQIVHWYQQWGSGDSRFRGDWLAEVAASGRIPMVSWEAWAKPEGGYDLAEQELGDMAAIAAGDHDDYIDDWAEAAAEYGQPLLLRPFHEMNGFWYPWSVGVNGNTAGSYVAGWRHVVDRFRAAGADNVSFVWSINTLASFEEGRGVEAYYPGDDYVDWVATSGFNWDDYDPTWSSWVTAEWVFGETYEMLAGFGKPVMFAEIGTGTNGGDGAEWVAEAMDWFATLPDLGAIVWFDRGYDGRVDFRLGADQQAELGRAVEGAGGPFGPEPVLVEHPLGEGGLTLAPATD